MSDPAESSRPEAPASNPAGAVASHVHGQGHDRALSHGHESKIAQPSTFLLPRSHAPAMPEPPLSQVDRDQQQGLVSSTSSPSTTSRCARRNIRPPWRAPLHLVAALQPHDDREADSFFLLQRSVRNFLRKRTSYDVLPLSFRLIILNTDLLVKKSLNILLQNGPSPPTTPQRALISSV